MNAFNLKDKQVFIFDAFGTIFKTSTISNDLKNIVGESSELLLSTWRRKQLEYSWLRNQMEAYVPFDQITAEAFKYAMEFIENKDKRIFEILLPIYDFPTIIEGAKSLFLSLKNNKKLACILSNGTMQMLENGVSKTGIGDLLDHIFSVDDIKIYKPDPQVYQMALDKLNVAVTEVVFFSSNQWDISGASNFGIDCVWVNQYSETKEILPFGKVLEVSSLHEVQYNV